MPPPLSIGEQWERIVAYCRTNSITLVTGHDDLKDRNTHIKWLCTSCRAEQSATWRNIWTHRRTCCRACAQRQTFRKIYGQDNPMQNKNVQKKAEATNEQKYGAKHPSQNAVIKEKMRATCLEKFGVANAMQNKNVKDRAETTCQARYGHKNPMQNEKVKARESTCEIRYGCKNPMRNSGIKRKAEITCEERYGSKHAMQNEDVKKKQKATTFDRFGTENCMQNVQVQEKARATMLINWGVGHAAQNEEIKAKMANTNMDKYGYVCPLQNEQVKRKNHETLMANFNVDHPFRSEEIRAKARGTMMTNWGVPHAMQNEEIKSKFRETSLAHFGAPNPMQCTEIFHRNMMSAKRKIKVYKMPSGAEIRYQGYENFALDYLVKELKIDESDIVVGNKIGGIRYPDTESKIRMYYPDIFVVSLNWLLEIKSSWTMTLSYELNLCKWRTASKERRMTVLVYDNKGRLMDRNEWQNGNLIGHTCSASVHSGTDDADGDVGAGVHQSVRWDSKQHACD